MLYVAAQGAFDPASGKLAGETFEEQAARAFANVQAIVEAAGGSMAGVVKVTVYLADWKYFSALNEIYPRFFSEPYPARTPVQTQVPFGLIMVDAVALLED